MAESTQPFAHLHVHTEYSMLDGAARLKDLMAEVKSLGMTHVAMTDHGNMFGAAEFARQAKDAGVTPVIGIEAYVAPESRGNTNRILWGQPYQKKDDVSAAGAYLHKTIWAKDNQGLHNLFRLSSRSYAEGWLVKWPRMDKELLAGHSKGLMASTGCPSGELQTRLRLGQEDEALKAAAEWQDIFGKENYFLELMDHGWMPANVVHDLAFGDSDDKAKAVGALIAEGDPAALPLFQAMIDNEMQTVGDQQILIVKGDSATDALTGRAVAPLPEARDDVIVNNRLRRTLATGIAAFKLVSPDRSVRLAAAKELQNSADEDALPAIVAASAKESDSEVKNLLVLTQASIQLASTDRAIRLAAIRALAQSDAGATKTLLLGVLEKKDGKYVEADGEVRAEAQRSLAAVERRLATGDIAARIFSGVSLGTILLLAALGLAITYGLMGVINMAHGELIMIGAYATYVVQNLFRQYAPGAFDWYLPVRDTGFVHGQRRSWACCWNAR